MLSSRIGLLAAFLVALPIASRAEESAVNAPPKGFVALFNGQDLAGWRGGTTENPAKRLALSAEEREKLDKASIDDIHKHWRVENGELVNDGTGQYLTTARDYANFELRLEYKTVAKADSGVYLRGIPQVQIWDTTKEGGKWDRNADKGSGGLVNNAKGSPGQLPLVHADRPFGEWNSFVITMVGDKVSVVFNGKLVVDQAPLVSYFEKDKPLPAAGPIQLQTHGGEIRWRNVFLREIEAEKKPATATQAVNAAAPEGITWETGIEYSNPDNEHLQLNLARPKAGDGPFPAVLCIHGGGFRAGKRESYDALCQKLAERGFVAATITYRLAPKHKFPAAVHDTKAAVRWLRANAATYKIDPERIGVTGGSAGGHLAQFLGVTAHVPRFEGDGGNPEQSSRVACVVNVYGPSDFTKSYGKSVDAHEVLPLWFGGNLETHHDLHIQGSPLYWVTPDAAPTLCIHGTEDKYVAHEQAAWIVDKLTAAAVPAELLTLAGAGHGFKGAAAERADQALFEFFEKQLKK